ncbi:hypothetical protein IKE79_00190 [Candidatus Saccharibacteria bacterium]|nr:hypothetical protein [Candidatus Saccharibacteria bacterium]
MQTNGGQYYYVDTYNIFKRYPNNFIYSGSWDGSIAADHGVAGYYRSSSAYSAVHSYTLTLYGDTANVYPGTHSLFHGAPRAARES